MVEILKAKAVSQNKVKVLEIKFNTSLKKYKYLMASCQPILVSLPYILLFFKINRNYPTF